MTPSSIAASTPVLSDRDGEGRAAAVVAAEANLDDARVRLAGLRAAAESADRASDAATPGGLHGYDPAVLSGIRRKPNRRADARRHAAYDRSATASRFVREQEQRVGAAEHRLAQARRDASAPCDLEALKPGCFVRDRYGWNRVVRVNAKTVSVESGYSWVNRIPKDRIIETRAPKTAEAQR